MARNTSICVGIWVGTDLGYTIIQTINVVFQCKERHIFQAEQNLLTSWPSSCILLLDDNDRSRARAAFFDGFRLHLQMIIVWLEPLQFKGTL